ncbi:MAG: hypothetical protein WD851_03240 [Pirellulales bacterium]
MRDLATEKWMHDVLMEYLAGRASSSGVFPIELDTGHHTFMATKIHSVAIPNPFGGPREPYFESPPVCCLLMEGNPDIYRAAMTNSSDTVTWMVDEMLDQLLTRLAAEDEIATAYNDGSSASIKVVHLRF